MAGPSRARLRSLSDASHAKEQTLRAMLAQTSREHRASLLRETQAGVTITELSYRYHVSWQAINKKVRRAERENAER